MSKGYIYCITNPSWENYYKIGLSVDVVKRLSSYQTGSPLRDYIIERSWYVSNMNNVEEILHEAFKGYRAGGEWFTYESKDKLLTMIEDIILYIRLNEDDLRVYIDNKVKAT